jgi:hypothetical protein
MAATYKDFVLYFFYDFFISGKKKTTMNIEQSIEDYVMSFSDEQIQQCFRILDHWPHTQPLLTGQEPLERNEKIRLRRKAIKEYMTYSTTSGKCTETRAEFLNCIQNKTPSSFLHFVQMDWYYLRPLIHTLAQVLVRHQNEIDFSYDWAM